MVKKVTLIIGAVIAGAIVIFLLEVVGLANFKFFGPKFEDVRREVFESTRSYNQAKMQELSKYRLEYIRSDDDAVRSAIASTIRHRFADYDKSQLPSELRDFVNQINE